MVQKLFEINNQDELKKFIKDSIREAVEDINYIPQKDPDELLTTKEAVKELKVSRQTLIKIRDRGEIKAFYIGNLVRYRRGDLNPYRSQK